jgi:hypothetical protein
MSRVRFRKELSEIKIEKRDIAVIGISAFGGFLLVLISLAWAQLIAKDVATALLVALLMGVPGGAGGGVLACLFRRYLKPIRMTSAVWRLGATWALICGVVLLLTWLALAFVFSLALKQSFGASLIISAEAVGALEFLAVLVSWLYGRCVRGRILLDCGPFPGRRVYLLFFALSVFAGFCSVTSGILALDRLSIARLAFASALGMCCLFMGFCCLFMACGRLQVREHGIWVYCGLLRWSKIGSYRWTDDSTLFVTSSGRLSFFRRGALLFAPERRQAVDDLLTQHCGGRHVT